MAFSKQRITFAARDGRPLAGWLVGPQNPQTVVLLSPGVALPKEHYLSFAKAGARRGAAVLIYDYRAQAGSASADLSQDLADFQDWGRLDMTGAIDYLTAEYPAVDLVTIGHSAGGWILGLADNHQRAIRHAFICVGWGYWQWKFWWFKPLEQYFWRIHGPLAMRRYGYVPKGNGWQGEALNPKLFQSWRQWCHQKNCNADFMAGGLAHSYDQVTAPLRAFAYSDDPIANARSVPPLMAIYGNAQQETHWYKPQDFNLQKIGHEGLFHPKAAKAWVPIWDWVLASA